MKYFNFEIIIFRFFMKILIEWWYLIYQINLIEARGINNENLGGKKHLTSFLPIFQYKIDAETSQAKFLPTNLV